MYQEKFSSPNLNDDIWSYINKLSCNSTNLDEKQNHKKQLIKIIDMFLEDRPII